MYVEVWNYKEKQRLKETGKEDILVYLSQGIPINYSFHKGYGSQWTITSLAKLLSKIKSLWFEIWVWQGQKTVNEP